ncbi:MAG TPA: hypothetical protein VMU17_07200 [Elusimicrobiota bacterium]|nr:hypothetical protein [Elusimicrobiota bacterium]
MFLLRASLGFLLISLGLAYLLQPTIILRMNTFMRERIFHDTHVLLRGRRIGSTLIFIGSLLLILTLEARR